MTNLNKMTKEEKFTVKEAGIYGYHLARVNNLLEEINGKTNMGYKAEDLIEWLLDQVSDSEVVECFVEA